VSRKVAIRVPRSPRPPTSRLPEDLGRENSPRRYIRLRFAEPGLETGIQTFVELERNHLLEGDSLRARAVTLSARPNTESLGLSVLSGEGTRLKFTTAECPCGRGLTRHEFDIGLGDLPSGGYRLAWSSRRSYSRGDDSVRAEAGRDAVAERTGYFRRAFRSGVDRTLQPYAVRIPAGYDPRASRKFPLIVFLHRSASDETNLAGFDFLSEGDCIELAPRGRGPSARFRLLH
jgi:hypothetical protein